MDASEWADFKTSTPATSQPVQNAPTGPQPSDWADFNPQPGYQAIIPPAAFGGRLQAGQAVGNAGMFSKMGQTFTALWNAAKEGGSSGFNAGADAEGLSKQWEKNREDLVKYGLDRNPAARVLLNTAQAMQGTFALMGGAFNGALGAAGSVTGEALALHEGLDPVAAQQKREDYAQHFITSAIPITMEMGMNPAALDFHMAKVLHDNPSPGGLDPAIVTKNGQFARLRQTADGTVEAQNVGGPPTPDKFQQAAKVVASVNPHATPEELQTKMINLWNNYGYHPAEAATDALENPGAAHELATGPDVPPIRNNDYEASLYHKQNYGLKDSLGPIPSGPEVWHDEHVVSYINHLINTYSLKEDGVAEIPQAKDQVTLQGLTGEDTLKMPARPNTMGSDIEKWLYSVDGEKSEPTEIQTPEQIKARLARAKALGFNTDLTLYHGTGKDFMQFKLPEFSSEPAIFLSDSPTIASKYSGIDYLKETGHLPEGSPAPNIIPIWAKIENPKTIDWNHGTYYSAKMSKEIKAAKAEGHDALIIKNIHDIGSSEPQTQYAFFEPHKLRAKYGAAFDPFVQKEEAHMLSAAASGPQNASITSAFIRQEDNNLFRLMQKHVADKSEMLQRMDDMSDVFRTPEGGERLYNYMEGDPNIQLSPAEQAAYEKDIVPLRTEEHELWTEIQKYDLDTSDYDPSYVHRMVKGKNAVFDQLSGDGSLNANPIGGRSLSQSTSSMRPRTFYVMQDAEGNRQLIEIEDGIHVKMLGPNGVSQDLAHPLNQVSIGSKLEYQGKDWDVVNARTPEIEAATDIRYYKNGLANTAFNVLNLRSVRDAIFEIERLKNTPEFIQNAIPIRPGTNYVIPDTHSVPKMPLLSNYALPRHLTEVLDDFYGRRGDQDLGDVLNKIGRITVQSLFWTPTAHMANVAADWAVTRGFDNLTPAGMKSLAIDLPRAIAQVATQGPDYLKFMREGSGLVRGRIANKDFYTQLMKKAGMDVVRNPAKWDPIARTLGIGPSNLIPMFYNAMSEVLFATSDVFMMQRLYELQRRGLDARAAIDDAERTIANYRMPPRVFGSRFVQQVFSNPIAFEFSRYHYDNFKMVATLARDMAHGTAEQRMQTMGRIMTLGIISTLVWPVISHWLDKATGDPNLKWGNFGVTKFASPIADYAVSHNRASVPKWLSDYYDGNSDVPRVLQGMLTPAPVLREGLDLWSNRGYGGQNVAEPADWKNGNYPAVAGQEIGHALGTLVQPYNVADQAQKPGMTLWHTILTNAIGAHTKTPQQKGSEGYWQFKDQQEAAKRHLRSTDIIERAIQAAETSAK